MRRDANDKFKASKKNNEISEDELKVLEKEIQDLTDNFCKEIDVISAAKDKEITEI
ncbi:MAG: ribosome-recycling factor [Oscillospiraceae bacterium]